MKYLNPLVIFFTLMLSGCSNNTTVYLYAKYLDDNQIEEVKNTFERSEKYRVEINKFDFPTTITENTLLYSLLLREPQAIDMASDLSSSAGFPILRTQGLTEGNHWYTKNSIALFLFPKNKDNKLVFFQQDLVNEYKGQNCDTATSLKLNKNGLFNLAISSADNGSVNESVNGTWKYRQHPFLELKTKGATYSEYYFEIKQFRGTDKVSEIDYVELVSLNTGSLPEGCSFLVGTRIWLMLKSYRR